MTHRIRQLAIKPEEKQRLLEQGVIVNPGCIDVESSVRAHRRSSSLKFRQRNRQRLRDQARAYYNAHAGEIISKRKDYMREYWLKNKERIREVSREAKRRYRERKKSDLVPLVETLTPAPLVASRTAYGKS